MAKKAVKKKSTTKRRRKSSTAVSANSASFKALISAARKAGMKRKKPKKPKTKTLASLEKYVHSVAQWTKDIRSAAAQHKRLIQLKEKVSKM